MKGGSLIIGKQRSAGFFIEEVLLLDLHHLRLILINLVGIGKFKSRTHGGVIVQEWERAVVEEDIAGRGRQDGAAIVVLVQNHTRITV